MAESNLDFKNLPVATGVTLSDFVVLSLFGGTSSRISVGLFRSAITDGLRPVIGEDGYWYVGDTATDVLAEGKTPEFRKARNCIEYKYTTEGDDSWRPLIQYDNLRIRYEDLTEEQYDTFRLHFEDLTEENIKELQKPASDMIASLEETNKNASEAEAVRISNENDRLSNEATRVSNETSRTSSENDRISSEKQRLKDEEARVASEAERVKAEALRKEEYESIKNSLVEKSSILLISEEEYESLEQSGQLEEDKLYFAYEE